MNTNLKELKKELKALAKEIRQARTDYKDRQRNGTYREVLEASRKLFKLQWEFRHKHIAYCLLRGRTMEQIENKNRKGNEPDQRLIDKYYEEYYEETICAN